MKQKLSYKIKKGINSNTLKIIAISCMIVDHVGYYFHSFISEHMYTLLRTIGRISMPLFVYILVQGFFHTKNLKKYMLRLGVLAICTQAIFLMLQILDVRYTSNSIMFLFNQGNILFSFVISLFLMDIIYNKNIFKKFDYNKNMIIKTLIGIAVIGIYLFIPIDYNHIVPLLAISFYFIEKFKISLYMSKQSLTFSFKKIVANTLTESKIKIIYMVLITITLLTIILSFNQNPYMLLAIPFIALYNFEKGKSNVNITRWFYISFPLHHIILYFIALFIYIYK